MSGMFKKAVGLALALIIIAMCAVSALAAQETEPNNTKEQANTIPANTVVYGTTHSDDWDDWYKITINQDGYVWIDFTHEHEVADHYMYLLSYDGTSQEEYILFVVSDKQEKNSSDMERIFAGTYYIQVSSGSFLTSNYSLKVNFSTSSSDSSSFDGSTEPSKTPSTQNTTTTTKHSTAISSSDYINITADNNSQSYADSNGIANETVADKNEASSNAAAKKNKAEKKTAESKSKKLSTPMIIIICVAAAAIIAVVVVIIVMSRKKNELEADNGFKYKQ